MPVRRKDFSGTRGRRDTQVKSLGGVPRESYCIIVFTYICLPALSPPSVRRVRRQWWRRRGCEKFWFGIFFSLFLSPHYLPFSVLTLERRGLSRMMCPLPPQ